jgi:polar amino acid transport system substrate-binding protein
MSLPPRAVAIAAAVAAVGALTAATPSRLASPSAGAHPAASSAGSATAPAAGAAMSPAAGSLASPAAGSAPAPAGSAASPAVGSAASPAAPAAGAAAPAPACDPRASLRPAALPALGRMPDGSTMARIAARGRLIAGVGQDTYLFAARDPETGRLDGFEIDIARAVAAAIFGDPERVELRPLEVVDRLPAVESGAVDLVVDTLSITCERRQEAEFSQVYFEAGQRVLVDHDDPATSLDDLGGRRVCAARGSTSLQNVLTAPAKPMPVGADTETDCLMLLQLGEVDAVSTDDALLVALAAQDPRTKIVGPRFTDEPYGIAINRSAPDLVRFVNAVLEQRARSGAWTASYARWLGPLGAPPAPPQARYRD